MQTIKVTDKTEAQKKINELKSAARKNGWDVAAGSWGPSYYTTTVYFSGGIPANQMFPKGFASDSVNVMFSW